MRLRGRSQDVLNAMQRDRTLRLAVFSESPADEAALRIIIAGLYGRPVEPVATELQARGWPGVRNILPAVIKKLHFSGQADALVALADADDTSLLPGISGNRLHELEWRAQSTLGSLPPHAGRKRPLRFAAAIAAPALEAWLLSPQMPDLNEGPWSVPDVTRSPSYRAHLKQCLYGTPHPHLELQTRVMVDSARELLSRFSDMEARFPRGFKPLADAVRAWREEDDAYFRAKLEEIPT